MIGSLWSLIWKYIGDVWSWMWLSGAKKAWMQARGKINGKYDSIPINDQNQHHRPAALTRTIEESSSQKGPGKQPGRASMSLERFQEKEKIGQASQPPGWVCWRLYCLLLEFPGRKSFYMVSLSLLVELPVKFQNTWWMCICRRSSGHMQEFWSKRENW